MRLELSNEAQEVYAEAVDWLKTRVPPETVTIQVDIFTLWLIEQITQLRKQIADLQGKQEQDSVLWRPDGGEQK